MASKFAGVAAYEVWIDKETGDMESPRILTQIGTVPSLDDCTRICRRACRSEFKSRGFDIQGA